MIHIFRQKTRVDSGDLRLNLNYEMRRYLSGLFDAVARKINNLTNIERSFV